TNQMNRLARTVLIEKSLELPGPLRHAAQWAHLNHQDAIAALAQLFRNALPVIGEGPIADRDSAETHQSVDENKGGTQRGNLHGRSPEGKGTLLIYLTRRRALTARRCFDLTSSLKRVSAELIYRFAKR